MEEIDPQVRKYSVRVKETYQFIAPSNGGERAPVTSYGIASWTETKQGYRNPIWRDLVSKHKEAGTPYSRTGHVNYTMGQFLMTFKVPYLYGNSASDYLFESLYQDFLFLPEAGTTRPSPTVYNTALGNFLVNVGEELSPFKGMVFLGELRETLKMLRRPASALRDGFSAYLKRARHAKKKMPLRTANKVISGLWLEYCYGWQPLMADIKSAARAYMASQSKVETRRVFGKASDRIAANHTTEDLVHLHSFHMYVVLTDTTYTDDTVIFKGEVLREFTGIQGQSALNVSSLSGFTLSEFVPTVWELIPYSFVADYFTNIGVILNSIHGLTANLAWKSCSRKTSTTRERGYKPDRTYLLARFPRHNPMITDGGRPSKAEVVNYTRDIPVLTVPSLVLHLPSSNWQWVNLAALMSNKIP